MSIVATINTAIDRGAKHLKLSKRQFHALVKSKAALRLWGGKVVYRGAVIERWK